MLSNKLIEYLKYTDEEKQALDSNFRKQYDFQIREKVEEAISHFKLLISSHSEDQLRKIFTEGRIKDLIIIIKDTLDIAGWRHVPEPNINLPPIIKSTDFVPLSPAAQAEFIKKSQALAEEYKKKPKLISGDVLDDLIENLQRRVMSEIEFEALKTLNKEYISPFFLLNTITKIQFENNILKESIALRETILAEHGISGEALHREIYTHRSSGTIINLQKILAETQPDSIKHEQIQNTIDTLSISWEEHKKRTLDEINRLEELKKKAKTEMQAHNLELAIQLLRKQI